MEKINNRKIVIKAINEIKDILIKYDLVGLFTVASDFYCESNMNLESSFTNIKMVKDEDGRNEGVTFKNINVLNHLNTISMLDMLITSTHGQQADLESIFAALHIKSHEN